MTLFRPYNSSYGESSDVTGVLCQAHGSQGLWESQKTWHKNTKGVTTFSQK